MGKSWNPESIVAAGEKLPDGSYTLRVVQGEEGYNRDGKYVISIKTRVVGGDHNNFAQPLSFTIGKDGDLEADEDETWKNSFPARLYKAFLKACDVEMTGDVEEELASVENAQLMVNLSTSEAKDGSGRQYQNANAFYRVPASPAAPVKAAVAAKAGLKKAKAVPAMVDADDEYED